MNPDEYHDSSEQRKLGATSPFSNLPTQQNLHPQHQNLHDYHSKVISLNTTASSSNSATHTSWQMSQEQSAQSDLNSTAPSSCNHSSSDEEGRNPSNQTLQNDRVHGSAVRTLFISGLPSDTKEREIFNLFRFLPGFVDCSLKNNGNGKQAVAFASWLDHDTAKKCRDALHGIRFDPYGPPSFLRIQFARTDSKVKRTKEGPMKYQGLFATDTMLGTSTPPTRAEKDPNISSRKYPSRSSAQSGEITKMPDTETFGSSSSNSSGESSGEKISSRQQKPWAHSTNRGDQGKPQPCSTLFIANLSMQTSEDDLRNTFSQSVGFRRLRFQMSADGLPICFVDFDTEENSSKVMQMFQGTLLHQSPIRIEYARQRMNRHNKNK